jgi:hypothetical protein
MNSVDFAHLGACFNESMPMDNSIVVTEICISSQNSEFEKLEATTLRGHSITAHL